jgi:hypothetical protein
MAERTMKMTESRRVVGVWGVVSSVGAASARSRNGLDRRGRGVNVGA